MTGTMEAERACMMKNLFEQSRSHWVRYDHYELKTAEDGKRYITPGQNAKPDVYNPLKEVPNIVLDALNVGMLMMGRKPEAEVEKDGDGVRHPVRPAGADDRPAHHTVLYGL